MLTANEVAKNYAAYGEKKVHYLSKARVTALAVLAGAFIALGYVAANAASATIENESIAKLISALIFPAGLAMVTFTGSELFTSDCLVVMAAMNKKISYAEVIRFLVTVYIGNFIGALLIAILIHCSDQLSFYHNSLALFTMKAAVKKVSLDFMSALILGIFCNICVCISSLMAASVKTATEKFILIYIPVVLFVVSGFEHCVANMYFIPVALLAKLNPEFAAAAIEHGIALEKLTVSNFLLRNLLPVTIGNIIGGAIFISLTYHLLYLRGERS